MMAKKLTILALVLVTCLSLYVPVLATNEDDEIVESVLNEVLARYTTDYSISDVIATIDNKTINEDGSTTYQISASFKRTLLATDALEVPAIQGMLQEKETLSDPEQIAAAESYIAGRIADLNDNYIGVAQSTSGTYYVTRAPYSLNALSDEAIPLGEITVQSPFEDGESAPLTTVGPRPISERVQSGRSLIADVAENADNLLTRTTPHNPAIMEYDRVAARDYAQDWSCNLAISTDHASCHNAPKYDFYDGERGSDCANFVSQCLHEGGLDTDDTWYIDSPVWVTTGNNGNGLRQWMVDNDLFFHTTDVDKAFAGSVVNDLKYIGGEWVNGGHVGIVDQNDFTTQTLCAHSRCRRSVDITGWTYTDDNNVQHTTDYYVPYWDDHFGQWVSG